MEDDLFYTMIGREERKRWKCFEIKDGKKMVKVDVNVKLTVRTFLEDE